MVLSGVKQPPAGFCGKPQARRNDPSASESKRPLDCAPTPSAQALRRWVHQKKPLHTNIGFSSQCYTDCRFSCLPIEVARAACACPYASGLYAKGARLAHGAGEHESCSTLLQPWLAQEMRRRQGNFAEQLAK